MRAAFPMRAAARALTRGACWPLLGLLSSALSACSWSRFDDVTKNSPIVLLEKPGSMTEGYGVSVATAKQGSDVEVLIGGGSGVSAAALYAIGDQESPSPIATDTRYCAASSEPCYLSSSPAPFAITTDGEGSRPLCFALGSGTASGKGLIVRCQDATEYLLSIPVAAEAAFDTTPPADFPLASDRSSAPTLLVASSAAQLAWFYPAGSTAFTLLDAPVSLRGDTSFGKTLAVLALADAPDAGRVYAVGVPARSEVLLWRSDGHGSASFIGCLGGMSGFGRALAGGKVDSDAVPDLVVSDDMNVHVIDGNALAGLPETTSAECGLSLLPTGALIDSFGCQGSPNLGGCAGSDFGAALAVGDLDEDGLGEVIVGAPAMTVRGTSHAGALLVYDLNQASDSLADVKFLSSGEAGDLLGTAIAAPSIDGREIIVAGAPGRGKAALFYCSPLLPKGAAGARCP